MKAWIEVENRKEAELIRAGLADPEVRAFVKVMGTLHGHTPRAQRRILHFVQDHFQELEEQER